MKTPPPVLASLAAILVLFAIPSISQLHAEPSVDAWPTIHHEAKPWAYWWWMGSAVNKKDISRLFEKYKKIGIV